MDGKMTLETGGEKRASVAELIISEGLPADRGEMLRLARLLLAENKAVCMVALDLQKKGDKFPLVLKERLGMIAIALAAFPDNIIAEK